MKEARAGGDPTAPLPAQDPPMAGLPRCPLPAGHQGAERPPGCATQGSTHGPRRQPRKGIHRHHGRQEAGSERQGPEPKARGRSEGLGHTGHDSHSPGSNGKQGTAPRKPFFRGGRAPCGPCGPRHTVARQRHCRAVPGKLPGHPSDHWALGPRRREESRLAHCLICDAEQDWSPSPPQAEPQSDLRATKRGGGGLLRAGGKGSLLSTWLLALVLLTPVLPAPYLSGDSLV